MTRLLARYLMLVSFALLAVGCAKNTLRDDAGNADATGNIGSPLVRASPADVYIDLSGAYLREGRLTEAFMNAKKAVIVDPGLSNAHYMLALVYQRLGELGPAESSYKKAISLDSRNPVALNAYGSFLCELGRFEESDQYFQRALKNPLYSTPWIAWNNAGWCAESAGDSERAEQDYRAALKSNSRFAPSLLGMANVSFENGIYLSARAYLQRYAEVAPHTAESLWLGVRTENQLGDKNQMASYGLKLRTLFPDSEQAKFLQTIE
jgi:type IV pilus assembly protein PilF